jgi:hypothetical protein
MTAGGTCTITVAFPLDNSGSSAYTSYRITGTAGALGSSGLDRVDVWRLYNVTDTGSLVADHLVNEFPIPIPYYGYFVDGSQTTGYTTTRYPTASIVEQIPGPSLPVPFQIVPQTGQIRFSQPVVNLTNSQSTLQKGGSAVVAPADLWVLLAYARGALSAVYPADISGVPQYSGTAFSLFGYEQTAYVDIPSWLYAGDQSLLDAYAEMMQQSKCNVPFLAPLRYHGWLATAMVPPVRLNIAGTGYTTGYESASIPIRSYKLKYLTDGRSGLLNDSDLGLSDRRDQNTGDRLYVHPRSVQDIQFKLSNAASVQSYDGRDGSYEAAGPTAGGGDFGYVATTGVEGLSGT